MQKYLQEVSGGGPGGESIFATYCKNCYFPFTVWDVSEKQPCTQAQIYQPDN